jgi:N-carbamoylputrescine amidase
MFLPSMRTCAAQNLIYVVATNRGGVERVAGRSTRYYGLSCIVGPRGELLAVAGEAEPGQAVGADLDLGRIGQVRQRQTMYRDRRPELYGPLTDSRAEARGGGGDGRPA